MLGRDRPRSCQPGLTGRAGPGRLPRLGAGGSGPEDPHPPAGAVPAAPHQPPASPRAVGPLTVSFSRVPTLEQIQAKNPAVREGGQYQPSTCEPRSRTAVIIPHRNRETHLGHLLYYLHPFLQRQQLQYGIYVVHQVSPAGTGGFARHRAHPGGPPLPTGFLRRQATPPSTGPSC